MRKVNGRCGATCKRSALERFRVHSVDETVDQTWTSSHPALIKIARDRMSSITGVRKNIRYGPRYEVNVMFLCTHNSCRSQMADAFMSALRGPVPVGVASAGIQDGREIKSGAIKVMDEVGIDLRDYASNSLAEFSPECKSKILSFGPCTSNHNNSDYHLEKALVVKTPTQL